MDFVDCVLGNRMLAGQYYMSDGNSGLKTVPLTTSLGWRLKYLRDTHTSTSPLVATLTQDSPTHNELLGDPSSLSGCCAA